MRRVCARMRYCYIIALLCIWLCFDIVLFGYALFSYPLVPFLARVTIKSFHTKNRNVRTCTVSVSMLLHHYSFKHFEVFCSTIKFNTIVLCHAPVVSSEIFILKCQKHITYWLKAKLKSKSEKNLIELEGI